MSPELFLEVEPTKNEFTGKSYRFGLENALTIRHSFQQAEPFPYLVLDGFLEDAIAEKILEDYPDLERKDWLYYYHFNEKTLAMNNRQKLSPVINRVFDDLQSREFLTILETLTGYRGLKADDTLESGGLQACKRKGFLNMHTDFTVHPFHKNWQRRINLILYFNKDWKSTYRGDLEFWDRKMQTCVRKIPPFFNRCVIFETNENTFHGYPDLIQCPSSVGRLSLSLYYYTEEKKTQKRSTNYKPRPGDSHFKKSTIWCDKIALKLYYSLKSLFHLNDSLGSFFLKIFSQKNNTN